MVRNAWSNNSDLYDSFSSFSRNVMEWNRVHFGNIFAKKKRILARLGGIQKALAERPSDFLVNLDKLLQADLLDVLNQEEELWALKSRVNWMIQGDRNTSFYHVSTLIRRKHNKILNLKNTQGDWINDLPVVMEHVRNYFSKLFSTELLSSPLSVALDDLGCPQISSSECHYLSLPVTDEEIKNALWSMKAFKSPGPDGLHAGFFQRFWLVVGKSVSEEIKKIFNDRKVPLALNQTYIAFIPKKKARKPLEISNLLVYATLSTRLLLRLLWPELDLF